MVSAMTDLDILIHEGTYAISLVMLVLYYILRVGVDDAGCFAALVAELEAELED